MGGRTVVLGGVLFVVYLVGALLVRRLQVVPWEALVVLLPVGVILIWRFVARRPFAELGIRRVTRWRWHLGVPAAVAVAYSTLTLVVAHGLGVQEIAGTSSPPATLVLVALLLTPLIAGVFTALPEEFVFRGFFLQVVRSRRGLAVAAVVSSVLFAFAHLPSLLDAEAVSGAALGVRLLHLAGFGLLMVWAAVRTGALWFPIAWHAGANYPAVLAELALGLQRRPGVADELLRILFLVGEVLVLAAVLALWARFARPSRTGSCP